jgi:septum formation protein
MTASFPPLILASNSPRRQQLLHDAGLSFVVKSGNVPELYPPHLKREQVPIYLSQLKANAILPDLNNELLIAADTIVHIAGQILEKPSGIEDAITMLQHLSGKMHEVITGVTICNRHTSISFHEVTEVYFADLTKDAIEYYTETFKPYDKAGAYGIQEWIGLIGVEKINGCFYNVMGLPINKVYKELMKFPFP